MKQSQKPTSHYKWICSECEHPAAFALEIDGRRTLLCSQHYLELTQAAHNPTPTATTPSVPSVGLRFDTKKARFDLMPSEALIALAELYGVGSEKYSDRNWEHGMAWGRCFGSLMRHAWKWLCGEDYDPESGCHHMIHVAWNALALFTYHTRGVGHDDRSVTGAPPKDSYRAKANPGPVQEPSSPSPAPDRTPL